MEIKRDAYLEQLKIPDSFYQNVPILVISAKVDLSDRIPAEISEKKKPKSFLSLLFLVTLREMPQMPRKVAGKYGMSSLIACNVKHGFLY